MFGGVAMGERRKRRKSTLKPSKRVVDGLAVERGDRVIYVRDLTGSVCGSMPVGARSMWDACRGALDDGNL